MTGPKPKMFELNYDRMRRSAWQERRTATRLGGYVLPRSGGLPWSRHDSTSAGGDITTPEFHIEHKRIESRTGSIGLKREWLHKVTEGADRRMRTPAMVFHFEGAKGYAEDWMLIPLEMAERLLGVLRSSE